MPYASSLFSYCFVAVVFVLRPLHRDLHRLDQFTFLPTVYKNYSYPCTLSSTWCCLISKESHSAQWNLIITVINIFLKLRILDIICLLVLGPRYLRMLCCFLLIRLLRIWVLGCHKISLTSFSCPFPQPSSLIHRVLQLCTITSGQRHSWESPTGLGSGSIFPNSFRSCIRAFVLLSVDLLTGWEVGI